MCKLNYLCLQDLIMLKLDKCRKGVFGPPVGKRCVDNLNMPAREHSPPLSCSNSGWTTACGTLYHIPSPVSLPSPPPPSSPLSHPHLHRYDKKDTSKLLLVDIQFMGANGRDATPSPPGSSTTSTSSPSMSSTMRQ